MDIQTQINLRTKKLAVLLRDARLASRRSAKECAEAIGVTPATYRAYERGKKAPSLPELEALAYYLQLPFDHFWSSEAISDDPAPTETINLSQLLAVRHRMVGALLRKARLDASISLKALSAETGIPVSRIKAYEMGGKPIPLPELEGMLEVLGGRLKDFIDKNGPIGEWLEQQRSIEQFLKLPKDLQEFVCKPVNLPYLELARKLNDISASKLRQVAEDLLDITF